MSTKALKKHLEPLKPFLQTKGVTEICINQPEVIFVEKGGVFTRYEVETLGFSFLAAHANLIAEFNHKPFPCPLLSGYYPQEKEYNVLCRRPVKKITLFVRFVVIPVVRCA